LPGATDESHEEPQSVHAMTSPRLQSSISAKKRQTIPSTPTRLVKN